MLCHQKGDVPLRITCVSDRKLLPALCDTAFLIAMRITAENRFQQQGEMIAFPLSKSYTCIKKATHK